MKKLIFYLNIFFYLDFTMKKQMMDMLSVIYFDYLWVELFISPKELLLLIPLELSLKRKVLENNERQDNVI